MSLQDTYDLYYRFIEAYEPQGFLKINPKDNLMLKLEELTEKYDQFFYIADMIDLKILYTSKRSLQMIGIKPELISPHIFYEVRHPDEIARCNYGLNLLFKQSREILYKGKSEFLFSSDYRMRNASGVYSNFLIQAYLFYSEKPHKTVYFLKIHTNISEFKNTKYGSHFYVGSDLSYFRYPNQHLLNIGNIFSPTEFKIIQLIHMGLNSMEIAEKLYRSVYTVRTHRRNILKKTGKNDTAAVIYDLQERGML
jgi:hypothetical protein